MGPTRSLCYWERQSAFGGGFEVIIANENLQGPGVVTIDASDTGFKTSGCRSREKVAVDKGGRGTDCSPLSDGEPWRLLGC